MLVSLSKEFHRSWPESQKNGRPELDISAVRRSRSLLKVGTLETLPKIYTTKAHRHANARPKPRNARRISGSAIRCSQVPIPSDDDNDGDDNGGSGGVVARAIQTREKTGEIPREEAVLHKSPKRESYRRHGVFES